MESKKSGKGLIVLVVILSIMVVGLGGYICYDKLYLGNDEQNAENKQKETNKEELNQNQMSKAVELHKTLTDGYNAHGLYFGKKETIETVPANDIMPYLFFSYFKEKELYKDYDEKNQQLNNEYKNKNDIVIEWDEDREDYIGSADPVTISKKELEKYLKEKFNTNRVLEIKGQKYCNKGKCDAYMSPEGICLCSLYDIDSEKVYFGCPHNDNVANSKVTSKFLKHEVDGNNMYIYDKPIVKLIYFQEEIYDQDMSVENGSLITLKLDSEGTWKITSDVIKDLDVKKEELNEEYIFENYDKYLVTYKHTFKKADNGKYYWYSSEIVK